MTSVVKKISTLLLLILCLTLALMPGIKAARRADGIFELTDNELKANYEKYIVPNLADEINDDPLDIGKGDVSTPEGHFTDNAKKEMLDTLNFARSVVGCDPVTWDDNNEYYAQKGTDYLVANGLDISHTAADGKDEDASRGLHASSLAQSWWAYSVYSHIFSWIADDGVPSVGHRCDILNPNNTSVGMSLTVDGSRRSIFTAHNASIDYSKTKPIVCVPTAGVFPIEEIEGFYYDTILWSIELGEKTKADPNKITISISDETGKTIQLSQNSSPESDGDYFYADGSLIRMNPYTFAKKKQSNLIGHTYTVKVTGLEGEQSSIEYTTKIVTLKDYKPVITPESEWDSISFDESEIYVKPGEARNITFKLTPNDTKGQSLVGGSTAYDIANYHISDNGDYMTIYGKDPGDATITLWTPDQKRKTEVLVHVTNDIPQDQISYWKSIGLDKTEVTLKKGETVDVGYSLNPDRIFDSNIIFQQDSNNLIQCNINNESKKITLTGVNPGDTVITIKTPDQKRETSLIVHVVDVEQSNPDTPNPDTPSEPDTPDTPSNPSSPSESDTPDTPSNPSTPSNPNNSNQPTQDNPTGVSIYRLYNSGSGEHLYTSDLNEYNTLPSAGWTQEGVGWTAPSSGDPVYRLYSPVTGAHLYTKDENEVNTLLANGAWTADNNRQPIMYSNGSKSVFRLYNEGIRMHLLTTDENEYNVLGGNGWNKEGVALNALN